MVELCTRSIQVRAALDKIPESERAFWTDIYNHLCNVECDRDYYKAIVDGSWPSADEILSNYRKTP